MHATLNTIRSDSGSIAERELPLTPLDEHNIVLLDNVKPAKWVDPPASAKPYSLVVIGAGSGGLVSAASIAGLGGRVALIEKHMLGGDCLNFGCVPSKALVRCAHAAKEVQRAGEYGIDINGTVTVNFPKVMERMRRLRAGISHHDSAERFTREVGCDVFQGHAKFVSGTRVEVNGQILSFKKCIIASGGQARVPNIPGIQEVGRAWCGVRVLHAAPAAE